MNIPISNKFLWPHGYASQIAISKRSHTYKLQKHIRLSRRHVNCNKKNKMITKVFLKKTLTKLDEKNKQFCLTNACLQVNR